MWRCCRSVSQGRTGPVLCFWFHDHVRLVQELHGCSCAWGQGAAGEEELRQGFATSLVAQHTSSSNTRVCALQVLEALPALQTLTLLYNPLSAAATPGNRQEAQQSILPHYRCGCTGGASMFPCVFDLDGPCLLLPASMASLF